MFVTRPGLILGLMEPPHGWHLKWIQLQKKGGPANVYKVLIQRLSPDSQADIPDFPIKDTKVVESYQLDKTITLRVTIPKCFATSDQEWEDTMKKPVTKLHHMLGPLKEKISDAYIWWEIQGKKGALF